MLLRRRKPSAVEAIEHLVGVQAQAPNASYAGLWTRLNGFRPDELADLISKRRAVRTPLTRTTIRLVTPPATAWHYAPRCSPSSPATSPTPTFGRNPAGVDTEALLAAGRTLL
jgi:hypothetical protein